MVWYRFVSEQIIRSFSPRSVRSTRRNPTLFASPWSSMACVRRLFWLKHWWQMMVALNFQCLYVCPKLVLFLGNWRKRWVALSIEVPLNVPHPFLQASVEGLVTESECKIMFISISLSCIKSVDADRNIPSSFLFIVAILILTFLPPRCFSQFWILLSFPL